MFLFQKAKKTHVVEVTPLKTDFQQHGAVSEQIDKNIEHFRSDQQLLGLENTGDYFFDLF
jgi:hypothetical protein